MGSAPFCLQQLFIRENITALPFADITQLISYIN